VSVPGGTGPSRARIDPFGSDLSVGPDETVMAAALRAGWSWPSVCGGLAQCTVCYVTVLDGLEHVAEPSEKERIALEQYRGVDVTKERDTRLACQMRLSGPVSLRKVGAKLRSVG
jgi:2Fe-2S ferredoxin